nr:uncharacterized protein LOC132765575 [Anolis sagrei ordinatus]
MPKREKAAPRSKAQRSARLPARVLCAVLPIPPSSSCCCSRCCSSSSSSSAAAAHGIRAMDGGRRAGAGRGGGPARAPPSPLPRLSSPSSFSSRTPPSSRSAARTSTEAAPATGGEGGRGGASATSCPPQGPSPPLSRPAGEEPRHQALFESWQPPASALLPACLPTGSIALLPCTEYETDFGSLPRFTKRKQKSMG